MIEKSKAIRVPDQVFILRWIYSLKKIKYPARLKKEVLGYFTSLESAEYYLTFPVKELYWFLEEEYPFKIFEIEEHTTNYFLNYTRTRIYDSSGNFYGELTEPDCYYWRPKTQFQFKRGDIVEFIHHDTLQVGIIVQLPPNYKTQKEIEEYEGQEGYIAGVLNHSGESYLVRTLKGDVHPFIYYCFPPSITISDRLQKQLQKLFSA